MCRSDVPYPRRGLYLAITLPLIALYAGVAAFLHSIRPELALLYLLFFVGVALFQSYCCAHLSCPYIGRFCPGAGGFCMPASQIARLLGNVRRTSARFAFFGSLAFFCLLGIVLLPVYFLFRWSSLVTLMYLGIVVAYAAGMLLLICPACAVRHRCPGGKLSCWTRGEGLEPSEGPSVT